MRTPRFFSMHLCTSGLTCALMILCSIHAAAGTERILHEFSGQQHGAWPDALVSDSAGNLFGTTEIGGAFNAGAVYEFSPKAGGGWTEAVLHSFSGGSDGSEPLSLALDAQGNIFGLTEYGGANCTSNGCGTVFEITQNSSGKWTESVIYSFGASDGYPTGALAVDAAGNLYGAISNYVDAEFSVFELTPSGNNWTKTILYSFPAGTTYDVTIPGLLLDGAGNLYGTLTNAISAAEGLVFELTPSSGGNWTETTVYTFLGGKSGGVPTGALLLQDGNLYGATLDGGDAVCEKENGGCGVVFELRPSSNGQWSESVLYVFQGTDSDGPIYPSVAGFDSDGNLYGLTEDGGAGICSYCGSLFQLVPNGNGTWTETDLRDFAAQDSFPTALVVRSTGQLYGTDLGPDVYPPEGKIFELAPVNGAWRLRSLYRFPWTDGQYPSPGLIADGAGNLYGTTQYGGSNNIGAIFEVSPVVNGWKESLLYSFGPISHQIYFTAGASPLTSDGKGNFYGTTEFGGAKESGSVFEVSPQAGGTWQETDLFSFSTGKPEPTGGVVFDKSGNIYGVTYQGGTHGAGTVFELTQNGSGTWQETAIYNFEGYPSDAGNPVGGLTMDAAGNLYGTTEHGGDGTCSLGSKTVGCGTVFELSYVSGKGWTESVLHNFLGVNGSDGASPMVSLIFDGSGNLYGTTLTGGVYNGNCYGYGYGSGCGTVFELSPAQGGWGETLLYEFTGGGTDGSGPGGPLLWDQAGNLYGTVAYQAANDFGALFKLTPAAGGGWTENLFYTFQTGTDGRFPVGGLIFSASGSLYGVTAGGGIAGGVDNNGQGTLFEIKP